MTEEVSSTMLLRIAAELRLKVLEMIAAAGKGHLGGSLSVTDILVALYPGGVLNVRSAEPAWPERDRLIYSKAHACEAFYAVLAEVGLVPAEWLSEYGRDGSKLGGHPDTSLPGVEMSGGSLGHGLGVAAGMALSAKLRGESHKVFAVLGDGECYEGSVWESATFAAHHQLSNLVAIVDRNFEITLSNTEDCNRLEPFADKWRSCGWEAIEIDGHDLQQLTRILRSARNDPRKGPIAIVAKTVKGKGVSFMEAEVGWHHRVPGGEVLERARAELGARARSLG